MTYLKHFFMVRNHLRETEGGRIGTSYCKKNNDARIHC